eukprot:CAMPEP_0194281144 /NCGR_PEP_ID=MMETSP0169-20130528/20018_1 /TAXON_ID=218684 /ORGANISM="Corethron pennatum, Strain L29A3" /LENGTH=295 /DNA_ID=CAMNT_0039026119 /DNA_START=38 /DNA_END=925 /DNA_ORIENTATION=+
MSEVEEPLLRNLDTQNCAPSAPSIIEDDTEVPVTEESAGGVAVTEATELSVTEVSAAEVSTAEVSAAEVSSTTEVSVAGVSAGPPRKLDISEENPRPHKQQKNGPGGGTEKASTASTSAEFEPPLACVRRVLKRSLPKETNFGRDASSAFTRAAGIFIIYVTACANDFARENKRQTITANDILSAIKELDFEEFSPQLEVFLTRHREDEKRKKDAKNKAKKDTDDQPSGENNVQSISKEPLSLEQLRTDADGKGDDDHAPVEKKERSASEVEAEEYAEVDHDEDGNHIDDPSLEK